MLSEDEKKAIELLTRKVDDWNCKRPKNPLIFTEIVNEIDKDNNAIKTALNLITKLQKEIEHQKEKRENQKSELAILNEKQKEMNKLINTVKTYQGQFKRQEKVIKQLKEENEEGIRTASFTTKYFERKARDGRD